MNAREVLLTPIKIGTRTCQNRFFSQPMECTDADAEGNPSDLTYERYENLSEAKPAGQPRGITITDRNRSRLNFVHHAAEPALTRFVKRLKSNPKTIHLPADDSGN
jgi:2,4-dienoyl-CoA reductase-like NADH-dependent reductase (Old Yellow Enzyme family)